jgi:serine/threonine-protein kinase
MPSKVTLKFTKGSRAGSELVYTQKEVLYLGRDEDDCKIVFPEPTISRRHCFLEIVPPQIRVHDLGSKNGTFVNGILIGKREADMSPEEGLKLPHNEYQLKSGDRLGLSGDCEITVEVQIAQRCSACGSEIEQPRYRSAQNRPLCPACYRKEQEGAKARPEVPKARPEVPQAKPEVPKAKPEVPKAEPKPAPAPAPKGGKKQAYTCQVCKTPMDEDASGPGICADCLANPFKILTYLLKLAKAGDGDVKEIAGYEHLRTLGRGGMGEVWLVKETATGKEMALKIMLPRAAAEERSKRLFLREAHIGMQLKHNNVVEHFHCGRSGDVYFILMDYCRGGSVDRLMKEQGGKLGIDLATRIIRNALDGLHYAHTAEIKALTVNGEELSARGIVHRDFKPANLFLDAGMARVADFGLAKAFDSAGLSGFTQTGAYGGSLGYMPRQQIVNFRDARPEVDVWAAAATYYSMLTGYPVRDFEPGKDPVEQILRNDSPPVPTLRRNPKIPKALAEVIDAALVDHPRITIKTAKELKDAINKAL